MSGYLPPQSVSYFRLRVIFGLDTRVASWIFSLFHCEKRKNTTQSKKEKCTQQGSLFLKNPQNQHANIKLIQGCALATPAIVNILFSGNQNMRASEITHTLVPCSLLAIEVRVELG